MGLLITGLMAGAYFVSLLSLNDLMMVELMRNQPLVGVGSIFAFGLVAFGFLCMGPVNIAVDSYGPVTDNAQSVFELAQTEQIPGIKEEIQRDFGFVPDFEVGKHYLEANDSAGNTFKATAKPVLIGTAVVGATTMIFSIILVLGKAGVLALTLTDAPVLLGFMCGGAVVFWFSGASMQAVTTGAYRAVEYIKKNMDLTKKEADINDSIAVVRICTEYAQAGMWNIFIALMTITLAFAFFNPNFFVAYLISIAVFGLFQAIYMANAGGSWDNAKKLVEVDLKEKGTPLHAATVIGDTVGDPFKDTTSVSLNPIIKFSTLFGLLAVEIAVKMTQTATGNQTTDYGPYVGVVMLAIALYFVWRSFYAMRIPKENPGARSCPKRTPRPKWGRRIESPTPHPLEQRRGAASRSRRLLFPRSQALLGNARRRNSVSRPVPRPDSKRSFADGVPKQSLGTRGEKGGGATRLPTSGGAPSARRFFFAIRELFAERPRPRCNGGTWPARSDR